MSETETGATTAPEGFDPDGAEVAAEAALARANVPPGMTVRNGDEGPRPVGEGREFETMPDRGAGQRLAEAAAEARKLPGGEDVIRSSEGPERDAMARLAADKPQAGDEELALDWLLSDQQEVETRVMQVRLGGTPEKPVTADWVLQAVGLDAIRSAEREAAGNRAQRRAANPVEAYDEMKANLRICAVGTIEVRNRGTGEGMTLADLARRKGWSDPVTWLAWRFKFRPGLIASIASEVMALSGFDLDDVKAAAN